MKIIDLLLNDIDTEFICNEIRKGKECDAANYSQCKECLRRYYERKGEENV